MTETIQQDDAVLAIILSAGNGHTGSTFFTPDHFPLQLGLLSERAGHRVGAHYHAVQQRQVCCYQEVLFIRKGRVLISLYNNRHEWVANRIVSQGDCVLLASGGHAVELLDDAEIIEIKQGPFMGNDDKVFIAAPDGQA